MFARSSWWMTCRAAGRRFDCGDRRRLRGSGRLAFFIPAFVLLAGSPWARDLDGDLPTDLHLNAADSPVLVRQGLRVPEGLILSIEPGVEFRLGEGACIVVEGEIQALGERRERIVFRALDEGLRWGNLKIIGNKDLPSYDGDYNYIEGGGSRLPHGHALVAQPVDEWIGGLRVAQRAQCRAGGGALVPRFVPQTSAQRLEGPDITLATQAAQFVEGSRVAG